MPIRPEMKHLYPPPKEWRAIRHRILVRASDACECTGECGLEHEFDGRCGCPNLQLVERAGGHWALHFHNTICLGEPCEAVRVVLTIAHLDHDPTHNDDANLRAFCQRCHLRYDRQEHAKNAATTRARRRDERSGQTSLLLERAS